MSGLRYFFTLSRVVWAKERSKDLKGKKIIFYICLDDIEVEMKKCIISFASKKLSKCTSALVLSNLFPLLNHFSDIAFLNVWKGDPFDISISSKVSKYTKPLRLLSLVLLSSVHSLEWTWINLKNNTRTWSWWDLWLVLVCRTSHEWSEMASLHSFRVWIVTGLPAMIACVWPNALL